MSEKISFQDAEGKRISGLFDVGHGVITVTASDGRTKMAEIEEDTLSLRPSQECSYFNCIRRGDGPIDP
jgi:hypothetical protein